MQRLIVPELVEILAENNFFVGLSEIFVPDLSPYTFLYNENNKKGIIIKEYSLNEEGVTKKINSDVIQIRNMLNQLNYNVWNMYYFVVNTDKVSKKNIYTVERDYRSLRKYVISSLKDLNRVPFILYNSKKENKFNIAGSLFNDLLDSQDKEVKNIIHDIIINRGEYEDFKRLKIQEILNKNLSQGEFK